VKRHGNSVRLLIVLACATAWLAIAGGSAWAGDGSPDIVISQVYGGGGNSGAIYTHDFVELYNRGASAVDVSGWTVQYAASTSSSWSSVAIAGTIPAGGYYLIQLASGGSNGAPLPTPDATGTINMSASGGKVALVMSETKLTCGGSNGPCLPNPLIRDLVGYGTTADAYEGTGRAPALSASTAALRGGGGSVDTDDNSLDFTAGAPAPHNSSPTAVTLSHLTATADGAWKIAMDWRSLADQVRSTLASWRRLR
jgi:predicted extracellular nuclease